MEQSEENEALRMFFNVDMSKCYLCTTRTEELLFVCFVVKYAILCKEVKEYDGF